MRNLLRRLERLERPAGGSQDGIRLIVRCDPLALDVDRCMEILREAGFARDRPGIMLINFLSVPPGLNAQELERFLREHGDMICGGRAPDGASQ